MPWAGGVYTRGYPSWSNDAANNLPISATKFDTEDNDFAAGLNNCLTKDGLNVPTATLAWSQTAASVATFSRGSDGVIQSWARTGGANNPSLQVVNADATGIQLNLTTAQTLSLSIQGTPVLSVTATTISMPGALTASLASGSAGSPSLNFASDLTSGLYRAGSGDIGVAITGVQALDIQAHQLAILGAAATSATLSVAGNGVSIANGFQIVYGSAGGVTFNLGGGAVGTITSGGAWTINAPTSGTHTINGVSTQYALTLINNGTSGNSLGMLIEAGTTSADAGLAVLNKGGTITLFEAYGDGEVVINDTNGTTHDGGSGGTGTLWQVGYLGMPLNNQGGASYTLALTDRGKLVDLPTTTLTIPANGSVAFPVGTTIVLYNGNAGNVALNITTDSLKWLPSNATGNRTLAAAAVVTLYKVASTAWLVWGFGIS